MSMVSFCEKKEFSKKYNYIYLKIKFFQNSISFIEFV